MAESPPAGAVLESVQGLCTCSLQKPVQAEPGRPTSIGQESVHVARDWKNLHEEMILAVASVTLYDST